VFPLMGEGNSSFRGKKYLALLESQNVRVSEEVQCNLGQVTSAMMEQSPLGRTGLRFG